MKKTLIYVTGTMAIMSLAACNGNGNGSSSTSDTALRAGDSSVTTTTTTTVTHHRYSGTFTPQPGTKYLDLRTHKEVSVRIDTIQGKVVNQETNEPVDLIVEPTTHDTIYGQTGSVVNNYIIHEGNGEMRVDTVRVNTVEVHTVPVAEPTAQPGKYKEKDKPNGKTKIKQN